MKLEMDEVSAQTITRIVLIVTIASLIGLGASLLVVGYLGSCIRDSGILGKRPTSIRQLPPVISHCGII